MKRRYLLAAAVLIASCGSNSQPQEAKAQPAAGKGAPREVAIFAGGCFWCTEADFEKLPGVLSAASGYIGGTTRQPTYEQVSAGGTGHYEAVRIVYDPRRTSYQRLVDHYFRTVDPTDAGGQFCDRGESYRTAVFALNETQRRFAEAEKAEVAQALRKRIVTPVLPARTFWPAETYHQDYYKKNPIKYRYYRFRCGRDARLEEVWGKAAK